MHRSLISMRTALVLFFIFAAGPCPSSAAQEITVAVAANFAGAMERMGHRFTGETGTPVRVIVGSTGGLYAQIKNRAPYDLFYAADCRSPERLFAEGLCGEPSRYATGEVVLWSGSEALCSPATWQEIVAGSGVKKIAIANPATAPYGSVALETVDRENLLQAVSPRLVYAANVGQAFQYAAMGVVDAAFVALSYTLGGEVPAGCVRHMAEAPRVEQKACLTLYGRNTDNAGRFLEFTLSDRVADIRQQFGYGP